MPEIAREIAVALSALEIAGDVCGTIHARCMQLEDERQALKPRVIQRLVEEKKATSASAAEKLVEQDAQYIAHRRLQYGAEIERWDAIGKLKAAELRAKYIVEMTIAAALDKVAA
jgi:hypothetical protein